MKTTVEIADALLEQARRIAAGRGTTLRALIEEGLRRVVEEQAPRAGFRLRRAAVAGRGLRPEVEEGSWERVRDEIYKGRGG